MTGIPASKVYSSKTNSGDFELNNQFLLGLQIAKSERKEAEIITGLLNLSNGFMTKRYTELQDKLDLLIIGISKKILEETTFRDWFYGQKVNGRTALSVSSNAKWDKRGSSRQYDSLSGCSVMLREPNKVSNCRGSNVTGGVFKMPNESTP